MADYVKPYQEHLMAGAIGVGAGFITRALFKKDTLPVKHFSDVLGTFVIVGLCSVGGEQLRKMISPDMKPN